MIQDYFVSALAKEALKQFIGLIDIAHVVE